MSAHRTATVALLLATLPFVPLAVEAAENATGRIEISGDYRYAMQESESLADA